MSTETSSGICIHPVMLIAKNSKNTMKELTMQIFPNKNRIDVDFQSKNCMVQFIYLLIGYLAHRSNRSQLENVIDPNEITPHRSNESTFPLN